MINSYRLKTTEQLIDMYIDERSRINDEDRITTQKLIKAELDRRFRHVMNLLDDQTVSKPESIYNELIKG